MTTRPSDEREKALEAWADRDLQGRASSAERISFRDGWDASEPEVERLRAEVARADKIARDAMALKNARAEQAERERDALKAKLGEAVKLLREVDLDPHNNITIGLQDRIRALLAPKGE
jgi:hypothetical protein